MLLFDSCPKMLGHVKNLAWLFCRKPSEVAAAANPLCVPKT
jgi:hypothetical protein